MTGWGKAGVAMILAGASIWIAAGYSNIVDVGGWIGSQRTGLLTRADNTAAISTAIDDAIEPQKWYAFGLSFMILGTYIAYRETSLTPNESPKDHEGAKGMA